MALLQRITTPFAALLPDLNRVPQQRQAVGAVVASLAFHLLLLLLFVVISGFVPEMPVEFAKSKPELQPLELTVDLSAPVPEAIEVLSAEELKARAEKQVIDSAGLAKSAEKPKDALFESDQNMKAASEKPATGDAPLPTQEGRDLPFMNFKDQDVLLGPPKPPASLLASAAPVIPEPMFQPKPIPPDTPAPTPDKPIPEPAAATAARTTPPPVPQVLEPDDSQIAIASKMTEVKEGPVTHLTPATPAFRNRTVPPPKNQQKRTELAKLTTPAPQTPAASDGFQEEMIKTRIDGGITNRGPAAVDADRTARGVFLKQVKAAIGSRWYYYVKNFPERYVIGSATLNYAITKDGKISSVRLVDNTSNASFGMMCQQCVQEAEIGPPPEDVLPLMRDGKLEDTFTFRILPPLQ